MLGSPPGGTNNPFMALIVTLGDATRRANDAIKRRVERLEQQDITNTALGHTPLAFADLPVTTVIGLEYYCSNCRKGGEGVGAGTGLNVFMDSTGTWKNVYNNTAAAA